jgi:hypothetical protein
LLRATTRDCPYEPSCYLTMTEMLEIENDEEYQDMGSLNHSIVQARTTGVLVNDERFNRGKQNDQFDPFSVF